MELMNKLSNKQLSTTLLILAFITYFAFNVFSANVFSSNRIDFTEEKLYTISENTKSLLQTIKEPITLNLYYSKGITEASPRFGEYYTLVKSMLEQYAELSGGKIILNLYDPEPFSETEDEAVAAGLSGATLNEAGDKGYFGLVATNLVDGREVIPFFSFQRERFLEYDISKFIYKLSNPQKKTIGILSALPVLGTNTPPMGMMPQQNQKPWMIITQLKEFFDVRFLEKEIDTIPNNIDTLLVIKPSGLKPNSLYAIDQFVLKGGNALIFADPHSESGTPGRPLPEESDINTLFHAWGIEMPKDKLAADFELAMKVGVNTVRGMSTAQYIVWLQTQKEQMDSNSALSANIEKITFGAAGYLQKRDSNGTDTTLTPIITTTDKANSIDAVKVKFQPDVMTLLREFVPGDKPLTLAARIQGNVKSAFPDKKGENHLAESQEPINVIVITDTDLLQDRFWVNETNFLGSALAIPIADNANFVMNIMEDLNGADTLNQLRGRGQVQRPFELIEAIQRDAEMRYRTTEQQLLSQLKALEEQIASRIEGKQGQDGNLILSKEEQKIVDDATSEMLKVRKELRNVQHALRKDIESIENTIKYTNIFFVPTLLILGAIILSVYRRKKRQRMMNKKVI